MLQGTHQGKEILMQSCLTQITEIPNPTGGNVRGLFWTRPDHTGKEVTREAPIDETQYSQFVDLFADTYFKEVYDTLTAKYKLGRIRLLWKLPRTTLSWHRDPEPRLHIPIVTNPGARMCIDTEVRHMPADGSVWITDNTRYQRRPTVAKKIEYISGLSIRYTSLNPKGFVLKKKIVVSNGGFDPISGHIIYFKEAKKLGDELCVAINSDAWFTRKKDKHPVCRKKTIIENLSQW